MKAITHTRADQDLVALDPDGHLLTALAHLRTWAYRESPDFYHRDRLQPTHLNTTNHHERIQPQMTDFLSDTIAAALESHGEGELAGRLRSYAERQAEQAPPAPPDRLTAALAALGRNAAGETIIMPEHLLQLGANDFAALRTSDPGLFARSVDGFR